jgi:ATP-dependent Clp protease protease subunit
VVCDEVLIAPAAMFMIHNAWTIAMGDRNDLLDTAALLEKVDGTLAAKYAARTGMKAEEVAKLMDAETWYTGQEAVDARFADGLDGEAEPDEDDREGLGALEPRGLREGAGGCARRAAPTTLRPSPTTSAARASRPSRACPLKNPVGRVLQNGASDQTPDSARRRPS